MARHGLRLPLMMTPTSGLSSARRPAYRAARWIARKKGKAPRSEVPSGESYEKTYER